MHTIKDIPLQKTRIYPSPLGDILLAAEDKGLCGLWFMEEVTAKGVTTGTDSDMITDQSCVGGEDPATTILNLAVAWLDQYFVGSIPSFTPPVHLIGSEFQLLIWGMLTEIPYGTTVSYGDLARRAAAARGKLKMSAQAVGGAVGANPVSLIVPCHRVIGFSGGLVGYGGGLWRKEFLLNLEQQKAVQSVEVKSPSFV